MTCENTMAKEDIAYNEQFLHFATVFSTLFGNETFVLRGIQYFCPDDIKVACCRFVVYEKGSKEFLPCFIVGVEHCPVWSSFQCANSNLVFLYDMGILQLYWKGSERSLFYCTF